MALLSFRRRHLGFAGHDIATAGKMTVRLLAVRGISCLGVQARAVQFSLLSSGLDGGVEVERGAVAGVLDFVFA